jgi:hypothetical protein
MEPLRLEILPQPDLTTCGPTCLHAVYRFFGQDLPLSQVIAEVPKVEGGGTLAVILACHALARGFGARIYSYNLQIFDPKWFATDGEPKPDLAERLRLQAQHKRSVKLRGATKYYLQFLEQGGKLRMRDLTAGILRKYLKRGLPLLAGLSSTFLYRDRRELDSGAEDDLRGLPAGHFVVICGYVPETRSVRVADPLSPNPMAKEQIYTVDLDRLVCAILLGIVTYDANFLVLEPPAWDPNR